MEIPEEVKQKRLNIWDEFFTKIKNIEERDSSEFLISNFKSDTENSSSNTSSVNTINYIRKCQKQLKRYNFNRRNFKRVKLKNKNVQKRSVTKTNSLDAEWETENDDDSERNNIKDWIVNTVKYNQICSKTKKSLKSSEKPYEERFKMNHDDKLMKKPHNLFKLNISYTEDENGVSETERSDNETVESVLNNDSGLVKSFNIKLSNVNKVTNNNRTITTNNNISLKSNRKTDNIFTLEIINNENQGYEPKTDKPKTNYSQDTNSTEQNNCLINKLINEEKKNIKMKNFKDNKRNVSIVKSVTYGNNNRNDTPVRYDVKKLEISLLTESENNGLDLILTSNRDGTENIKKKLRKRDSDEIIDGRKVVIVQDNKKDETIEGYNKNESIDGYNKNESIESYNKNESVKGYNKNESVKGYNKNESIESYNKNESIEGYNKNSGNDTQVITSQENKSVEKHNDRDRNCRFILSDDDINDCKQKMFEDDIFFNTKSKLNVNINYSGENFDNIMENDKNTRDDQKELRDKSNDLNGSGLVGKLNENGFISKNPFNKSSSFEIECVRFNNCDNKENIKKMSGDIKISDDINIKRSDDINIKKTSNDIKVKRMSDVVEIIKTPKDNIKLKTFNDNTKNQRTPDDVNEFIVPSDSKSTVVKNLFKKSFTNATNNESNELRNDDLKSVRNHENKNCISRLKRTDSISVKDDICPMKDDFTLVEVHKNKNHKSECIGNEFDDSVMIKGYKNKNYLSEFVGNVDGINNDKISDDNCHERNKKKGVQEDIIFETVNKINVNINYFNNKHKFNKTNDIDDNKEILRPKLNKSTEILLPTSLDKTIEKIGQSNLKNNQTVDTEKKFKKKNKSETEWNIDGNTQRNELKRVCPISPVGNFNKKLKIDTNDEIMDDKKEIPQPLQYSIIKKTLISNNEGKAYTKNDEFTSIFQNNRSFDNKNKTKIEKNTNGNDLKQISPISPKSQRNEFKSSCLKNKVSKLHKTPEKFKSNFRRSPSFICSTPYNNKKRKWDNLDISLIESVESYDKISENVVKNINFSDCNGIKRNELIPDVKNRNDIYENIKKSSVTDHVINNKDLKNGNSVNFDDYSDEIF